MSIVLVVFPAAPRPDPEAQRRDRELDDTLRQRLTVTRRLTTSTTRPAGSRACSSSFLSGAPGQFGHVRLPGRARRLIAQQLDPLPLTRLDG
ncbi:unnamed protein product [Leptidea sinapis]|uniref:Protein serine/threonine phosphatase 2C C-terminal domain-containing protein n=1 Tax=Leptidea sinapis TaxID=189913 RepID=A0A5E4PV69_9NEOP|nr:unnamed protein product [Leptidea sinapis]